jgi:hypothetical protein
MRWTEQWDDNCSSAYRINSVRYTLLMSAKFEMRNVHEVRLIHLSWLFGSSGCTKRTGQSLEDWFSIYLLFWPLSTYPTGGVEGYCCTWSRGLLLHLVQLNGARAQTHTRAHTIGRTPLDEGSARRTDLYLTTHNTHNRQTSMTPSGFEPANPANKWPQTHTLDRAASVIGVLYLRSINKARCQASVALQGSSSPLSCSNL